MLSDIIDRANLPANTILFFREFTDPPGIPTEALLVVDIADADLLNPVLVLQFGIQYEKDSEWITHLRATRFGQVGGSLTPPSVSMILKSGVGGSNQRIKGKKLRALLIANITLNIGGIFTVENV